MSQRVRMCSLPEGLRLSMPLVFVFTKIMIQAQIAKRGKKKSKGGGLIGSTESPSQHGLTIQNQRQGPAHTAHTLRATQNITAPSRSNSSLAAINSLQEIYKRSKSFNYVQFAHESRMFNREAHMISKFVCTFDSRRYIWFESPPVSIYVNTSK